MSLLFLFLVIGMLWLNMVGLGLLFWPVTRDYAVARTGGVLLLCLAFFFVEHFVGLGPQPPLLPFSTVLSIWLIWRHRAVLRENWPVEALFVAGFFYCLLWRYTFPNIDDQSERVGNLAFIEGYLTGERLPPLDHWLPPYRGNFYYSFQHYGAALLGRWLGLDPGMTYHLAYCTIAGLVASASGAATGRLCSWKWGRWITVLSLMIGGSGAVVATHTIMTRPPNLLDNVRFVGGTTAHCPVNDLGLWVRAMMDRPGVQPRDLPMEPLSYVLVNGDYHPPLSGYVLLSFAGLLIATLETGVIGRKRLLFHALLAATVPLALICNGWIFPLQALLVAGWLVYRTCRGEKSHWLAALAGFGVALMLEYPYLTGFLRQSAAGGASIRWTLPTDRTPWLGWLLTFWPVAGILLLAIWNRERRFFAVFLALFWGLMLAGTELFFNNDMYGGPEERFNTTMKWWPWVYAGIVLTAGATNLGSASRICRYGTALLLLPTCLFALDLGRQFSWNDKSAIGQLDGAAWITRDPVIKDIITALSARPDGVTMESGLKMQNTEAPAIALFSSKICLLGWPEHETTWRGGTAEIQERMKDIDAFYAGTPTDPLGWLLQHDVRYILWLPRDNGDQNARFHPLGEQIKSRYTWNPFYGNDADFAVGFWERRPNFPAKQEH